MYCGKFCGRIPPLEAMDRGLLPPPRNINALPEYLYNKPSLIDYDRWNKVMDDLREQGKRRLVSSEPALSVLMYVGAILPWDFAFGPRATWDQEDQDQRHEGRASKKRTRQTPHTSMQMAENGEDRDGQIPQPASQSMRSDRPADTETLPENAREAKVDETNETNEADQGDEVPEGEDANEASAQQQESEPLLEETEEPNDHAAGRNALPTWAAVFRDYGRTMVSRVYV